MNHTRLIKGLYWDRAWSLVEGCGPCSPGCDNCWAAAQAHMRQYQINDKVRAANSGLTIVNDEISEVAFNGVVRFRQDLLKLPFTVKKPTVWAVWTDLFHSAVKDSEIIEALNIIADCPRHIFLILTKRAARMRDFLRGNSLPKGPNLWLGVTACNQVEAYQKIPLLTQAPAIHRFVSVEPCLEHVKFSEHHLKSLDWVVAGPETGHKSRPCDPVWLRSLADQCQAAHIPFFDKSKPPIRRELPWERNQI